MYNCTVSENDNYTVPSLFVLAAGCTRALLSSLTNRGTSSSRRRITGSLAASSTLRRSVLPSASCEQRYRWRLQKNATQPPAMPWRLTVIATVCPARSKLSVAPSSSARTSVPPRMRMQ